jgi:UrcA family protein
MKRAIQVCNWTLQGVLGIGLAAAGVSAIAQGSDAQQVKIEASKVVTIKNQRSGAGPQEETVKLTHTVHFADLDLATNAGADELKSRIQNTASQVCQQLGAIYPAGAHEAKDREACIKDAVDSAMGQAKLAIASAQKGVQR